MEGLSRFVVSNFLLHSAEKARSGIIQCFIISMYIKDLRIGTVCHDFIVEFFLSHNTKKTSYGNTSVFPNFLVSKNSMDKNVGAGGVSCFSVSIFCRTVPIRFVGKPFCVSDFFRYR